MFDDRKESSQIEFEFVRELKQEELVDALANLILNEFRSKKVKVPIIESYVITQTIFPVEVYMKLSLKKLENNGYILEVIKSGDKRRSRGTFPNDCIITFK